MLEHVEITILSENRVDRPFLRAEPGLALHITSPEGDFLFDTGLEEVFLHNAGKLNIDLGKVDKIVFSHGHRDHTGGIYYYLQRFGGVTVICHYNIFNRKFRVLEGGKIEVGIPYEKNDLLKMGAEFIFKSHLYEITDNILLSGEIRRLTDYEKSSEFHQELVLESYITDKLLDDMALIMKTVKGLIILLGDAHSGAVNSVNAAIARTGISEVHAIIGGMNLTFASMEKIKKTARDLKRFNPACVIPLHSTGFRAINYFYNTFQDRLLLMNVGNKFTLDGS